MKTAILSIGTELLFGQITNTNTVYLSQQLNMLGFDVMYHYTVGDNPERVEDMIKLALKDCDMVITTGGLGPTQDDLTKEVVCKVMKDELVKNEDEMNSLTEYFRNAGKDMTENNRKQAYLPSRAVVFHNENGTAPGFCAENEGKYVICMPGPPSEMKPMFENSVKPFIQSLSSEVIYYRMARAVSYTHLDVYKRQNADNVLPFAVLLHFGTLVSVFIVYWKDIVDLIKELGAVIKDIFTGKGLRINANPTRRLGFMIIVATIPTAVIGLLFNDLFKMCIRDRCCNLWGWLGTKRRLPAAEFW